MNDFPAALKKVLRITLFFLSFCFLCWALVPSFRPFFAGFILGTIASLINSMYLAWKVNQVGARVIDKSNRRVNMGFISRFAISFMVVLIALEYKQHLHIATTLLGLYFVQTTSLIVAFISNIKNK